MLVHSLLSSLLVGADDQSQPKFLIVSTPRDSKVSYIRLGRFGAKSSGVQTLIDEDLVHPQGVAVDQQRKKLFVADPDARKVFSYDLIQTLDSLSVGPQTICVADNEVRWVTVDWVGNIYFTDEPRNQVLKISSAQALLGDAKPQVLYAGTALPQVSMPGGIASDSFYTFWVNKQIGSEVGSVIRATEEPDAVNPMASLSQVARNADKSYGICLALNNVFFTQPDSTISGVKKSGGGVVTVSDRLTNPRGCTWDGDGTVYVADRGANAVYSFASNMQDLSMAQLTKTADIQDAFGVAVFTGASQRLHAFGALALALSLQVAALLAT